jgi:hypothetical protein
MKIKIPTQIRTSIRKMVRNHPDVLNNIKTKSDVNNLTRDELIELADKLEIDFISNLNVDKNIEFTALVKFEQNINPPKDPPLSMLDTDYVFSGELTSDFKLSAIGVSQTLKIKFDYQHTPEWQYACLVDNRLKYRRGGTSVSYTVEVFDEEKWDGSLEHDEMPRKWVKYNDEIDIWKILEGPIYEEVHIQIEKQAEEEDKINRKKLGFPPSDQYIYG